MRAGRAKSGFEKRACCIEARERSRDRGGRHRRSASDGFGVTMDAQRPHGLPAARLVEGPPTDRFDDVRVGDVSGSKSISGARGPARGLPTKGSEVHRVAVRLPGMLEAEVESTGGQGKFVQLQIHDGTLATQGLVHGLSGLGWRVDVKRSSPREEPPSRDRRRRESRGENRERVERADV